jgi:hypothetical protein
MSGGDKRQVLQEVTNQQTGNAISHPSRETERCVRVKGTRNNSAEVEGASRVRSSKEFCVTVQEENLYGEVRQDFISYFDDLETFCVAVERYSRGGEKESVSECHIHSYLKFYNKLFLIDLRNIVKCFLFWKY